MLLRFISHQWVGSAGSNSALVVLVPGHLDVAVQTPLVGPGVLDQPVVALLLGAVADDQDAVIETLGIALGLVVDAVRVKLEALVAGVDGNGHGADGGNGLLQVVLGARSDVNETLVSLT